jgi:deoxyribodipyrimidine photo-lyase
MTTGIWWIRRDIRIDDNPALQEAVHHSTNLLPVFILDPTILAHPAEHRKAFLYDGLRKLDEQLRNHGSQLFIIPGDPQTVLRNMITVTGADAIFSEADYSPYSRKRDQSIAAALPLWLVHGLTVFPPGMIEKESGCPYTTYSHFSRAWKSLPLPAPCYAETEFHIPPLPLSLPNNGQIPSSSGVKVILEAGEKPAFARLQKFISGPIYSYKDQRNFLSVDGTSMLSPYLRFGMLSIRGIVQEARFAIENAPNELARQNALSWLDELIWREFYISILHYFPEVLKTSFRKDLRNIRWRNAPQDLTAWKQGVTGYPVVDAGMRQLNETGWMHNRARMITASFLVKDLLINWQEGESWFMQNLLDGDPATNNGGWQWTAGVGTDAAPYFRIFNPVLQSQKFDPDGAYIREWVPELANVPAKFIHQPWLMSESTQKTAKCIIGRDYPYPIVDHKLIKNRTLAAYRTGEAHQVMEACQ